MSQFLRRVFCNDGTVQVNTLIQAATTAVDNYNRRILKLRCPDGAVRMRQMMRDCNNRQTIIQQTRSMPPVIAVFKHPKIRILNNKRNVVERYTLSVQTILD